MDKKTVIFFSREEFFPGTANKEEKRYPNKTVRMEIFFKTLVMDTEL